MTMPLPDESVATLDEIEQRHAERQAARVAAGAVRRAGVSHGQGAGQPFSGLRPAGSARCAIEEFGAVVAPRQAAAAPSAPVDPLEARVAELERIVGELTAYRGDVA